MASLFLETLDGAKSSPQSILVGTGDNFAPELEARIFSIPLSNNISSNHKPKYTAPNKERYEWEAFSPALWDAISPAPWYGTSSGGQWVALDELRTAGAEKWHKELTSLLTDGRGAVGTDNVGCFLVAAGYTAVVPGKHDFYFGPERLRELARFLAQSKHYCPGRHQEAQLHSDHPVQMLAANLVIKTNWLKDHTPVPESELPKRDYEVGWQKALKDLNVADRETVYPWFSKLRVQISKLAGGEILRRLKAELTGHETQPVSIDFLLSLLKQWAVEPKKTCQGDKDPCICVDQLKKLRKKVIEFSAQIANSEVSLCEADTKDQDDLTLCQSDQNQAQANKSQSKNHLFSWKDGGVLLRGDLLEYTLFLDQGRSPNGKSASGEFDSILRPGYNYGLCFLPKSSKRECVRFSTYIPFFHYPEEEQHRPTATGPILMDQRHTDPNPYVLLKKEDGYPEDVAIFGVVDPDIDEYVGSLNFAWRNQKRDLKTVASVEDPVAALRQQLDYFDRKYRSGHENKPFAGLRVLLAQMSPARARALAALISEPASPEFQVVVTSADQDQGDDGRWSGVWKPSSRDSTSDRTRPPTLFAVPRPPYDSTTGSAAVEIGSITIGARSDGWHISTRRIRGLPQFEKPSTFTNFWRSVARSLKRCAALPQGALGQLNDDNENRDRLETLTLCVIQRRTGADVALVQKRDFFMPLPGGLTQDAPQYMQQLLDRIIWKGDFLNLIYIPGSALIKVMERSDKYDADDAGSLSPIDERGRGLLSLGIRRDKESKEYLVNEVPIDPGRLYAVATTDYIGAGDTGYPDLAAAALEAPKQPVQFPSKLSTISGLVCRSLFEKGDERDAYCLDQVPKAEYSDESAMGLLDARKGETTEHKIWKVLPFHFPGKSLATVIGNSGAYKGPKGPAEEAVEGRPVWRLSVDKIGISISALANNLSDEQIDQKFSGITASSVTAHSSHSWDIDARARLSRTSDRHEIFFAPGLTYNAQYTGLANGARQVNQLSNLATMDLGFVFMYPGRTLPHLDTVISTHFETPTAQTIATVKVGKTANPKGLIEFGEGRSFTILPRLGLRWRTRYGIIEAGAQLGPELYAISGFRFTGPRGSVTCTPEASSDLSSCVRQFSTKPNKIISASSTVNVLRETRGRAGAYLNIDLSIPFSSKVSYTWSSQGEFFVSNLFSRDATTDTRFREISKQQLKFSIWPSLSFGPAFQTLLYENQVNRDLLVQNRFMFEMDFSFEIINRRNMRRQVKYRPSQPPR